MFSPSIYMCAVNQFGDSDSNLGVIYGFQQQYPRYAIVVNVFTTPFPHTILVVGVLHTMAEGREAVDFHQSYCKKLRVWSLGPSHYGESPRAVAI
jgi:hypothetical protein